MWMIWIIQDSWSTSTLRECEILDSKIAKEIIENYSGRFAEKIKLLEEHYKGQAKLCIIFSFFGIFLNPREIRGACATCSMWGLDNDNLNKCNQT